VELLNTLFVTTQQAYLRLDHETVRVDVERTTTLRVPLLHLQMIACFGDVLVSPALFHRCGDEGRAVVLFDRNGRFKGRIIGPTAGNVLLRRDQHHALDDAAATVDIARNVAAGKVANARQILMRAAREADVEQDSESIAAAAEVHARTLRDLPRTADLDAVRGKEGDAARAYFEVFGTLVRTDRNTFAFTSRNRRPPRDPMNALLSFVYALVLSDCVSALEGVGLDPQVGFLHALRPGRPALALDLMEEFRPLVADRLALALVNRRQMAAGDFESFPGGGTLLSEVGRKKVIAAYQKRKQEEQRHRLLDRSVPLGLVYHLQARLLARRIRGDIPAYVPFTTR
jgi:CRISP-associated protein Cas1